MKEQQEEFRFSVTNKAGKKDDAMQLCLSLMKADTEDEVIRLLKDAGYWDAAAWRYYGDRVSNYNTIGNQQSRPDAALVEKLVNSVDAVLLNECLVRGINPEGPDSPKTIREAVATFFEDGADPSKEYLGRISEWTDEKRLRVASRITLSATGAPPREGRPCFTISDDGEGQTPEKMPETFLSLDRTNKLRIPFVQGKFNMGGTGVLKFCGKNQLQLILSRRNPAIVEKNRVDPSDDQWGFTIVRRELPTGNERSSVYTYLAPLGSENTPGQGSVLRFSAKEMPIFPDGNKAYARSSEWGSLVKLYEYSPAGYYSSTHILRKGGILSSIDVRLPGTALPIRLHECRSHYRGHAGSFATNMTGLIVRLEDTRQENIELVSSGSLMVSGEEMAATIYVFKKGRADTYRSKKDGILFTVNGQVHAQFPTSFFKRKEAGRLDYISDSILVVVDCSSLTGGSHEDLFMTSRDRLSGGELRQEIERALEDMLKNHSGLRELKEKRRHEEIQARLKDDKPLEETLISLLKRSRTLAELFFRGVRAANPFKTIKVRAEEKPFEGQRFPSYFKFKDKDYGTELCRNCHINMRFRIVFETDAVNDYLTRNIDPGQFSLYMLENGSRSVVVDRSINLANGIANLSVRLPDSCCEGDKLRYLAEVIDPNRIQPFENIFEVSVKGAVKPKRGTEGRRKPPSKEEGFDREVSSGISLPIITPVHESEWGNYDPPFDKFTALRVKASVEEESDGNGKEKEIYDFYVNMDNFYLQHETKSSRQDPEIVQVKFRDGLVLVGLALLREDWLVRKNKVRGEDLEIDSGDNGSNVSDQIEQFSKAIAPILLPMIDNLGALDDLD
jgi:hypothetical protein